ncbi:MAG: response regulator [Prolixibacteraceae bacterium]|nr:response regulator [Prolixibacteraceae bacterium]
MTTKPNIRILLVEDNEIAQRLVLLTIKKLSVLCDVASNGQEAVEMYLQKSYDIILMDMYMPVLDGLKATQQIRENENLTGKKPAYIVALTANSLADKKEICLEAGMDDMVEKPLRAAKLMDIIERIVE